MVYLECIELMRVGHITLPRPERDYLIEVRSGTWSLAYFRSEAERLRLEAEQATKHSTLPESVHPETISKVIAQVNLAWWGIESSRKLQPQYWQLFKTALR